MTHFKSWCPVLLSILVIILSLCPTHCEKSSSVSSKAKKRFRSHLSVISKTDQEQFPTSNISTAETPSEFQPPSSISRITSADHHRSGDVEREEDLFQPFSDFGSWGSQPHTSSPKQSSLKESYPAETPRYSLTSAEKFDKFGPSNNFGHSNAGQIYSSYPLGVGVGSTGGSSGSATHSLLDTYPYYDKEHEREQLLRQRAARDLLLNAAAASKLNALNAMHGVPPSVAAAASSLFANSVVAPDFDGYGDALALASGGHGHGWGWGWKEPQHHGSEVRALILRL